VIARYDEDYYAGQPAVTLNRVGRGQVIYAGTMGDAAFVHSLTAYACREAGVSGLMSTPPGVEVTARWKDTQRLLFVMNHSDTTQIVDMDSAYHDLLADAPVDSVIQLDPKQVAILV
jgi:beta-galactosidase